MSFKWENVKLYTHYKDENDKVYCFYCVCS